MEKVMKTSETIQWIMIIDNTIVLIIRIDRILEVLNTVQCSILNFFFLEYLFVYLCDQK